MNDIDLRSRWPVVQFQTKPDCRAFAATEAYNLFRALNGLPPLNASESFIDTQARADIGPNLPLLVDGCLAAMQKWGCPTEDDWNNSNWGITPPASVYTAAAKHKIKSWGKISLDDDPTNPLGIIPAIYDRLLRGHPVAIGCGVTQEFENGGVGGYIKLPAAGTLLIGAHAVALYGVLWPLRSVIFKNSRGDLWGDHGFGYLDFDWFLASGYRISSARFISEIIDAEPVPSFPPPTVNAMTIASIKALSNALVDPVTQAQKDQGLALFNALIVPVVTPPPVVVQTPPAGSVFGALDRTTKWAWQGVYGANSSRVAGVPGAAGPLNSGPPVPVGGGKFAWYGAAMGLEVAGPTVLYFVDDGKRVQRIDAIDPATGKVLETATVDNFAGGVYLPVNRAARLRITVDPNYGNALLTGIFT